MVRLLCVGLAVGLFLAGILAGPAAQGGHADSAIHRVASTSLGVGTGHACVLDTAGSVRCWGAGAGGVLGHGNVTTIGDDEPANAGGTVDVGGSVSAIATGSAHTCALLSLARVRCWGSGGSGRLGYGSTAAIGDDETPASAGDVAIFGTPTAIAAGGRHTCVLLTTGGVRCWGEGDSGRLGYGNTSDIGDNETPYLLGDVQLGGKATAVAAGGSHTCALLTTGAVRCWGFGGNGRLGYGSTADIGDDETPAAAGDVPLGGSATAIAAGAAHTCALLATGAVRCWGFGFEGRLGYGSTTDIGDDETPASAGAVPVGPDVTGISAGTDHTCAALATGGLRCWGDGGEGRLGYGNTTDIGDDETPASAGDVAVGDRVAAVAAGTVHTCAALATGPVRCWGDGSDGHLGHGNTNDIGDDEVAGAAGDVPVGALVRVTAPTRIRATATPRRDRRAPYVYRVEGKVTPIGAVADAATCTGTVELLAGRGSLERGTLAQQSARLRPDCTFAARLKLSTPRIGSRRRAVRIKVGLTRATNLGESSTEVRVFAGRARVR